VTTTDALREQEGAPSGVQLRSFGLLLILYAPLTVAVIPFAAQPGPADPKIVVVYGIGMLVADLCTAALLGALYRGSGLPAYLVLTCAYLYGGLMAGAHMATFPGALEERALFGGEQTVAWLFLAWRLGGAGLFLAAVIVAAKVPPRTTRLAAWLTSACALTVATTTLIAAIAASIEIEGFAPGRFSDIATAVQ
jgi:hypothetical protein